MPDRESGMWQAGAVSAVCDGCFRVDSYHLPVIGGVSVMSIKYEGWNFNSGNYLFTTDTK